MFRKQTTGGTRERKDRIVWRGHEILRIEAFSDAVFGFAITLLIVSLEVPKSFDELLAGMRSFLPFAICFTLLFQVWMTQNIFFRRYGLHDHTTLVLNGMLLFTVLFFVYPLKFLFNMLFLHIAAFNAHTDVAKLFYIYSGGYAAIYLLFAGMYWNALRQSSRLGLTASEIFETRTNIHRNLALTGIGLLSILIASCGYRYAVWSWTPYLLIGVALSVLHGRRGRIHRKRYEQDAVSTKHS